MIGGIVELENRDMKNQTAQRAVPWKPLKADELPVGYTSKTPRNCNKCAGPIVFKIMATKRGNRWCPVNVDGGEHWDTCKERQHGSSEAYRAHNIALMARVNQDPNRFTKGRKVKYVYCGVAPPWDESLGKYRLFNADERSNRSICIAL